MGEYLVLLYEEEGRYEKADPDILKAVMEAHMGFQEKHGPSIRGGNALTAAGTATSVRDDGATVTDGPFIETKEAITGYYLIEADDLDAALAVARDVPARFGGVEVRPIRVFD